LSLSLISIALVLSLAAAMAFQAGQEFLGVCLGISVLPLLLQFKSKKVALCVFIVSLTGVLIFVAILAAHSLATLNMRSTNG
jgi:hypothetical protein